MNSKMILRNANSRIPNPQTKIYTGVDQSDGVGFESERLVKLTPERINNPLSNLH